MFSTSFTPKLMEKLEINQLTTYKETSSAMSKVGPENYLCRCCHSEGSFESLYATNSWLDTEELVYYNLLRDCFDIELSVVPQTLQQKLCAICEVCSLRLQDAAQFKKQVNKCERRFRDVYSSYLGQKPTLEVKVKEEVDDDVKDVLAAPMHNGVEDAQSSDNPDTRARDDFDDDDGFNDPDDDNDYKPPEDEKDAVVDVKDEPDERDRRSRRIAKLEPDASPLTVFVEPGACARRRTTGATNTKKKKKVPIKKNPNFSDDDEEMENIDGITLIKVKNVPVRRNIDFTATEDGHFQCTRCPAKLKTDNIIRRHVQNLHLNAAKFKCPTCKEGFKSLGNLVKHKLEKHNEDHRFKCNACDKMFFENQFLKDHIDTFHMLGEKRKCKFDQCNFETYSKVSFYKHKIKHLSVKNHQCKYCQKAFKRKTYLVLHERIHTGDKRKVCTECGEAYIDRTSLRYHMTRRHPEINF